MIDFVDTTLWKSGQYKNAIFENASNNEGDWWVASEWFVEELFGFYITTLADA